MNGALRALLEGVIDYAGLFPPAKLPLAQAVEEYLGVVQGTNSWIVDRFACPAGKLSDLAVELAQHPDEPFVPISVIGTAALDRHHWKSSLEHDAAEMTKFQQAVENHAEVQAYEIRLPDHNHLSDYVRDLGQFANVDVFVELPWASQMTESLAMLAELESAHAKARTGGLEASATPTAEQLAAFIQQCVQLDLTFKLTAGLHEPLPSLDPASGAKRHGFLNVLAATALCLANDLSRREVEDLLNETSPKAIAFKREWIAWRGHRAKLEEVENARTLLVSFGSCSVQEPLDGLARIGLIERVPA